MAKHDINKILYFFIVWNQAGLYWNCQPLLPPSLRCHLLTVFKCFSNSLLSPCCDLYVKFRIFFDSSFVISRQRLNSITICWQILSSFATKRFFHKEKHVLLCDIAYIDENNCSLIKYNSNSVISLEIYTSFQKDK